MLVGPPGSGRSTQANLVSKKYQLVHISNMIKNEIHKGLEGKELWNTMKLGQELPDSYMMSIMEK